MRQDLMASGSILINAAPDKIWEVLTNPALIKEYLFGTETITDWKKDSAITFQGEYQGQQYKDKGVVKENIVNQKLSYRYWSAFSGLDDKTENYSLVTYLIKPIDKDQSEFTWIQQGFATEEGCKHCENGMNNLLQQIKQIAERN